jgi:hypothetical protein
LILKNQININEYAFFVLFTYSILSDRFSEEKLKVCRILIYTGQHLACSIIKERVKTICLLNVVAVFVAIKESRYE